MVLYGLKTCDTCRKAIKALEGAGRSVTFVDVRTTPVDAETLARWMDALGPDLVNRRSTTWKSLSAPDRAGADTAEGAVRLLAAHPTLMKRPVIELDGAFHLGWTSAVQAAVMS